MRPLQLEFAAVFIAGLTVTGSARAQWNLTGNAGTNSATHYVGTSDAKSFQIRVNNQRRLLIDTFNNWLGGAASNGLYNPSGTTSNNVIVGGLSNTVSSGSFIGGGEGNDARAAWSVIAGGASNDVASSANYGAIVGGQENIVSGEYGAITGGYQNVAQGQFSFVAGGFRNFAQGNYSLAAGKYARAGHPGCFVWSDSTATAQRSCSAANQFMAVASGGVYFYTGYSGAYLAAGSGTWANMSDRNVKRDIVPVNPKQVLARVAKLPISTWTYRDEQQVNGRDVRHMGPMAQDFHAAFGLGDSDKSITTIDEAGVALAAIQGLKQEQDELKAQNDQLEAQLERMEARIGAKPTAMTSTTGALALGVAGLIAAAGYRRRKDASS